MRDPEKMLSQQGGWSPEFLSPANIESVQTEYEVLHLMRQCANHFGFGHFLVARFPADDRQRFSERLLVSNWPADLVRKYDALNLFHVSRLALDTGMTKLPVQGDSALLAPADWESAQAGEAIALAESYGLSVSTALLMHSTACDPYLMVFSGTRGLLARPELKELHFAALQLFECLEKTFVGLAANREKLSSREVECLRWAAAGKSSDEIAIILGISVYTVSSYFKSATRKLQAVNRMQAIAIALRLRLI
ncbi:helix-turn-helix transcriptional regulator [Shinella zoogloeoides]|uniref:helix-turn-helix transcriptional regulator n=1 Tax=Shinella zoogloeoides TaxID=352475 RepID=UPI001F5946B2|nr:LuxR family transcriptional regulator [Shinella zoogloeoides]